MEAGNDSGVAAGAEKKPRLQSFYRRMKALSPIPYLTKARDYYVRSITECAGRSNYSGMGVGAPGGGFTLPKSFSTTSARSEEEYRELVRAASQRSSFSRTSSTGEMMPKSQPPFPRSASVSTAQSVGRIDEDSPCYFSASFKKTVNDADLPYPRSRSYNTVENLRAQRKIV